MISKNVFNKITKNGLTIAFAESMTGGMLCAEYAKNAGASKSLNGSVIAYSKDIKIRDLNVSKESIEHAGIVSFEVSDQMAIAIQKKMTSDIAVSITGNAGPTLQNNTHKQEACFTIIYKNELYHECIDLSNLSRIKSIQKAVKIIYDRLEFWIDKNSK